MIGIIAPNTIIGIPALGLLIFFFYSSSFVANIISKFYSEPINQWIRKRYANKQSNVIDAHEIQQEGLL